MRDEPALDVESLLNPDEQQQFRRLCLPTSAEELAQLPEVVDLHLVRIREESRDTADLDTAEAIGAALQAVLSAPDGYRDDERALLRGAVEYFLLADDAVGDLDEALGFDDDARVLNAVLARLGRDEHAVVLD